MTPQQMDIYRHCAQLVCAYCADPERWQPARRGRYPEWWHLHIRPTFNVRAACAAWAIWHYLERQVQASPAPGA